MNAIKLIYRLCRRCLLWTLITYWVGFISYTTTKFLTGGFDAVALWYKHIDSSMIPRSGGWFLTPWSWEKFLARQTAILATTVVLSLLERRASRDRDSRAQNPERIAKTQSA